jgi:hypothetical protein
VRIRFVRLITRRALVGISVAAFAAGCGNSKTEMLSATDVRHITTVRPTSRGWDWPEKPTQERLAGACDGWRWQDEAKLGVTSACLFDSPMDAQEGLPRARAFARGWAKRTVGYAGHFTDVRLDGLGEDAWRIQEDFPGGQEVTYGWRRANLLLQVHIQCIFQTCPSDIRSAARDWVDAIDEETRTRQ